jgi:GNAT superfamily N-acetyltransferase
MQTGPGSADTSGSAAGGVLLRSCDAADFAAVLRLLEQLWPELELDAGALRPIFLDCLKRDDCVAVCAVVSSEVVGFCDLTLRMSLWKAGMLAYVDELVVDAGWRGKGVGTELLKRAIEIATGLGCRHIALDSAAHRDQAHRFYAKMGFRQEGLLFGKDL